MSNLPSATTATAQINLPLPVGTLISYMGQASTVANLASLGWLVCDGSSVSNVTYPDLYTAIGTNYGGNGSPQFNLPDLRGCFMRSVDPSGVEDPDYTTRTSPVYGDATVVGPLVGSRQWHQVQNHQHTWSKNYGQISFHGSDINVPLCANSGHDGNQGTQTSTDSSGGGAETRPINVYAYFLIFSGLPQTTNQ